MRTETWLLEHTDGAPDRLVASMMEAVREVPAAPIPEQLADAAIWLFGRVDEAGEGREAALPLLAADALLTHAFEAKAELDPQGLDDFALVQTRAVSLAQLSR